MSLNQLTKSKKTECMFKIILHPQVHEAPCSLLEKVVCSVVSHGPRIATYSHRLPQSPLPILLDDFISP